MSAQKFKKGDKVRITANRNNHGHKIGDIGNISTGVRTSSYVVNGEWCFKVKVGEKESAVLEDDMELAVDDAVPAEDPKPVRKFKKGDKVKVIGNCNNHQFNIGDIVEILGKRIESAHAPGEYFWRCKLRGNDYAVRERDMQLVVDEPVPAEDPKPVRKFKKGDKVKLISVGNGISVPIGTILTIKNEKENPSFRAHGKYYVSCVTPSGSTCTPLVDDLELVEAAEDHQEPKPKFKVGDKVRVIGRTNPHHYFNIGQTVEVLSIVRDGVYHCKGANTEQRISGSDIELVDSAPKYKIGDQVRVTGKSNGHGFSIGDIVTICRERTFHIDGKYDYECVDIFANQHWYILEDEMEPADKPSHQKPDPSSTLQAEIDRLKAENDSLRTQLQAKNEDQQDLIEYIYDFAWHYGRFFHVGNYEKIIAQVKERIQLPEEFLNVNKSNS